MGYPVRLHVYDVTQGMARTMAPMLLGRPLDGVWHTGVEVFGLEYFFGGDGINYCQAGGTVLGQAQEIVDMGTTEIPRELFEQYLLELSKDRFKGTRYHLLDHNCNTFSKEVCHFLTGKDIPSKITNLPADILNTPLGQSLRPMIDSMMGALPGNASHHIGTPSSGPTAPTSGSNVPTSASTAPKSTSNPPKPTKSDPKKKNKDDHDEFGLD